MQAAGGASLISAPAEREAIHRAGSLQWAGLGAVAAAAIVADQLTKQAVEERVPLLQSNEVLPFVAITHVRNTGIAFGIFPGNLGLVSVLTAAAVVWMLVHFARSGARHVLFPAALGLLVGGSLSNLADRIRNGWVTDFIDISRWPTFNLADTFIVAGVALLLLGLARVERHGRAEPLEELEQ